LSDARYVGGLLAQLLSNSAYTRFLARHVSVVGVRIEDLVFILELDSESGEVSLRLGQGNDCSPVFWVTLKIEALEAAINQSKGIREITIVTGVMGQVVHPRVEQILIRCFEFPPYPKPDREDLIFPALFGFESPHVVWESKQSGLRVLRYRNSIGTEHCVSSGFSESNQWKPADIYNEGVSGAGYELFIKVSDPRVISEFVSWVKYVEETKSHLLPGNWLEYQSGKLIPNTNIAGFLIFLSASFEPEFPVEGSVAYFHKLLPVDASQLDLARRTQVLQVAERIEREDKI